MKMHLHYVEADAVLDARLGSPEWDRLEARLAKFGQYFDTLYAAGSRPYFLPKVTGAPTGWPDVFPILKAQRLLAAHATLRPASAFTDVTWLLTTALRWRVRTWSEWLYWEQHAGVALDILRRAAAEVRYVFAPDEASSLSNKLAQMEGQYWKCTRAALYALRYSYLWHAREALLGRDPLAPARGLGARVDEMEGGIPLDMVRDLRDIVAAMKGREAYWKDRSQHPDVLVRETLAIMRAMNAAIQATGDVPRMRRMLLSTDPASAIPASQAFGRFCVSLSMIAQIRMGRLAVHMIAARSRGLDVKAELRREVDVEGLQDPATGLPFPFIVNDASAYIRFTPLAAPGLAVSGFPAEWHIAQ